MELSIKLSLPDPRLLVTTSDGDYWHWNYQFPIKYVQRFRFKAVLNLMGDDLYGNLLEIGTGSRIFLQELSNRCLHLCAIDVHGKMDAVRKLSNAVGIKVDLETKSIDETGFPSDMFDAVVAVSVWEVLEHLEKAALETRRIVKRTDLLFTICPQRNSVQDFIVSLYPRRHPSEEFRNPPEVVRGMPEPHFRVVEEVCFPRMIGRVFPIYHYYKLSK